jgi:uncharacterized membrane protein
MMSPLLFNLSLAYACYFINDFLIKWYASKYTALHLIQRRTYFTLFFAVVWLALSREWNMPPSLDTLFQIVLLSIVGGFGLFFFVKANQHLSFPNVMVLNLVGLVSQQFIAYSILQEELKSSFPFSMILIIGGVFTLASIPALKKGLFYGLLSTLFWSLGHSLLSIPLKATSVEWTTLIQEAVILLLLLFVRKSWIQGEERSTTSGNSNWLFPLMGLLTICGSVLFNYAYQNYQVSQISILNILFFPLSALVSKVYFGEQLALREWLGNLLILLGVVYFQFF